jgi:hypothetical protein
VTVYESDPTATQRRARQLKPMRQRPQFHANRRAQSEHLADGGDIVQPSKEQEIRQQRMRDSAWPTARAPNPDATLIVRVAQPPPIPTPLPQLPTTARA